MNFGKDAYNKIVPNFYLIAIHTNASKDRLDRQVYTEIDRLMDIQISSQEGLTSQYISCSPIDQG